jgi:hypothetical protein
MLNFNGLVFAPKAGKKEEEEYHPIWEANLQPFFGANVSSISKPIFSSCSC